MQLLQMTFLCEESRANQANVHQLCIHLDMNNAYATFCLMELCDLRHHDTDPQQK